MEWIYGRQAVRLSLQAGARRQPRQLAGTVSGLSGLGALGRDLPARTLSAAALAELVGAREHQGIAAQVQSYPYIDPARLLSGDLVVALDEVADPRNVGAVARSALACGACGLALTRHRSAGVTPAAVKASAGATEHLPIAQVTNLRSFLASAKDQGLWVYGAAGEVGQDYLTIDWPQRVVLVLGSEGQGLRRLVAKTCDALVALPMAGPVGSLNVSVAAAVLLYDYRRVQPQSAAATSASQRLPRPAGSKSPAPDTPQRGIEEVGSPPVPRRRRRQPR